MFYFRPFSFGGSGTGLSDDISELEPPDSIPNSVVKRLSADGSVGSPHVRVGHCQALFGKPDVQNTSGFFLPWFSEIFVG